MRWPFSRQKTKAAVLTQPQDRGWSRILDIFPGAWQRHITVDRDTILANHAIFTCNTLIASDIAKLRLVYMKKKGEIWQEAPSPYAVLNRPNPMQNRIQFIENWILSKVTRGNAYILKNRDRNGRVISLYVLNPDMVQPLVSENGEVFYRLGRDNLADLQEDRIFPASEIIHDRYNCLFHPLVGLSPVYACGIAAQQGLNIQQNSALFFQNMSRPSGILTAPGDVSEATAKRIKDAWESKASGENIGHVVVVGDDLKYTPLMMDAEQSQLVEQLKLTADIVCATYHVPKYKVLGADPSYNNIEALDQQYYGQCLQSYIEAVEICLDQGLEVPEGARTQFDLDGLLRMDTKTQLDALGTGVQKTLFAPNEARRKLNLPPLPGGNALYLQEQNYSLEALAKRDAQENPFAPAAPAALPAPSAAPEPDAAKQFLSHFQAHFKEMDYA